MQRRASSLNEGLQQRTYRCSLWFISSVFSFFLLWLVLFGFLITPAILSLKFICYTIFFFALHFILLCFMIRLSINPIPYYNKIRTYVSSEAIVFVILQTLSGVFGMIIILKVFESSFLQSFLNECDIPLSPGNIAVKRAYCIDNGYLFILSYGSLLGFIYSIAFILRNEFVLNFPRVQKEPFFRYKERFPEIAKSSLLWTLSFFTSFLGLQMLHSLFFPQRIGLDNGLFFSLPIVFDSGSSVGHGVWGSVSAQVTLASIFLLVCWRSLFHLIEVHFTQNFRFGDTSDLLEGLSSPTRLVQNWAYQDLHQLTFYFPQRRRLLFSNDVSQARLPACTVIVQNSCRILEDLSIALEQQKEFGIDASAILMHTRLFMWAAESLGYLVASSRKEDTYGLVQKDLARVLDVLLRCLAAVSQSSPIKVSRVDTHPSSRLSLNIPSNRFDYNLYALDFSLRSAVQYIVLAMYQDLADLDLPSQVKSRLYPFIYFKK
eukprot:TRINITY_DN785_c0_g1_i1.p1 TRINITY_DN785_c0_g1~~TRINITY_DN785_c0_g1_i1.p1  ORF type:complete len:489 (+),score=50.50 TRINITY_DN785_c0_g1_i1:2-1468(+)